MVFSGLIARSEARAMLGKVRPRLRMKDIVIFVEIPDTKEEIEREKGKL
jgi:hypothetical protein